MPGGSPRLAAIFPDSSANCWRTLVSAWLAAAVAKDHLVAEERCDPIPGRYGVDEADPIPF